jgi:hypothetical protein
MTSKVSISSSQSLLTGGKMAAQVHHSPRSAATPPMILLDSSGFIFLHNDERMHLYQRGRTSITGLRLELGKIIETRRLVEVA